MGKPKARYRLKDGSGPFYCDGITGSRVLRAGILEGKDRRGRELIAAPDELEALDDRAQRFLDFAADLYTREVRPVEVPTLYRAWCEQEKARAKDPANER